MYQALRYTMWGHAQYGHAWHYPYNIYVCNIILPCSTAWGHQRTVGIPAGGRTPRRAADRQAPRQALCCGWASMLTLWRKEDTEEEAVPWELGNIKFQVGQRAREREREIKRKV